MDYSNHRHQLCISTSNDRKWNIESQSMAVRLLFERAFIEFRMNKVFSFVFAANGDETELLRKVGFSGEALLKYKVLNLGNICGHFAYEHI